LFCDQLKAEIACGDRVIVQNDFCVAVAPYASRFPFEVTISQTAHAHDFAESADAVMDSFGSIVHDVLQRLKRALKDPPYNFALHTAPNVKAEPRPADYWRTLDRDFHWHLEILPRLTRVAGLEWGTGFYVNSMPPEDAATFLRDAT
jgi:UDPglucose--hexose-1-phosphate uridylyltransferase